MTTSESLRNLQDRESWTDETLIQVILDALDVVNTEDNEDSVFWEYIHDRAETVRNPDGTLGQFKVRNFAESENA